MVCAHEMKAESGRVTKAGIVVSNEQNLDIIKPKKIGSIGYFGVKNEPIFFNYNGSIIVLI